MAGRRAQQACGGSQGRLRAARARLRPPCGQPGSIPAAGPFLTQFYRHSNENTFSLPSQSSYGLSLGVIFIGNLPYAYTEQDLKDLFRPFGEAHSVQLIRDRISGRSRGFGFVGLGDSQQESTAIEALQGLELQGRTLRISKKHHE